MKSIYFKNFLATAVMVLVSFLMIGVAFLFIGQSFVIKSHRESMEQNAKTVTRLIVSMNATDRYFDDIYLRVMLTFTETLSGNQVFLTTTDGYVYSCSDEIGQCRHIGNYVPEYYINTIDRLGKLDTTTDLGGLFEARRYVFAMPMTLVEGTEPVGYVFVSTDKSTIIGAWSAFIWVFFAVTLILSLRKTIGNRRWLLRVMIASIPLVYLSSVAGWIVAEVGRQPWTVYEMLPASASVSNIASGSIMTTFFIFLALFTILLIAELMIMFRQIKLGPQPTETDTEADSENQTETKI